MVSAKICEMGSAVRWDAPTELLGVPKIKKTTHAMLGPCSDAQHVLNE